MRADAFAIACVVGLTVAAAGCSCGEDPPGATSRMARVRAPTAEQPAAEQAVEVISVVGKVEGRMPGGEWTNLAAGDRLLEDESIRTVGGSTAVLKLGDTAQVELSPMSEFSVPEISQSLARVNLSEGRVAAVVNGVDGSTLRVQVRGNDAVAEATSGEFAVLTTGGGRMTVAATTGKVRLKSRHETVEVAAGQQTFVDPDQRPASPTAIPSSLYLKVGKPASLLQRERETTIGGRTTPGAVVSVNGVRVVSDGEGAFAARVPLAEGENTLTVRAEDVAGRTQSVKLPPIVVKGSIGRLQSQIRWTSGTE